MQEVLSDALPPNIHEIRHASVDLAWAFQTAGIA